ncbi:MAG: UvrD-helicase domain-containing protein, partial [Clostridiales bacterium]|nr:UvrD-helicase domain-containing protein [Clostridiales bacterium]
MRNWTDEQREAIEARGQNLLVSAGAGSGKTAVMIERICALLREGADLRETVVCTFTKTAAADMKRKLAAAMGGESDPRLRAQLRFLARAEISTLHSWCAHLIKQWFFDTDIDPEFTVLEEGEERALKSAAADAAIEEAKASGDRAFAGLYAVFLKNRSHRRLREAALSVYDYARAQPAPLVWLGKSAQCSDEQYRAQLREELRKEREALCAKMQSVLPAMASAAPADYAAFNALCECARAGVPYDAPLSRAGNKPEYAQPHETLKSLKAEYANLTKRGKKIDEMPDCGSSLPYCHALASLAIRTDELYCAAKRARGKADYADLEHGALRILRGEHGKEIAGKYK